MAKDSESAEYYYYDRGRKVALTPCSDWLVVRRPVADEVLGGERVCQIFGDDEGDGLPVFYQVGVDQGLSQDDVIHLENRGGLLPVFLSPDGTPVAVQSKILVSARQAGRDRVLDYLREHSLSDVQVYRWQEEGMYLVMVSGDARRTLELANTLCQATGVSVAPSFIPIRTIH